MNILDMASVPIGALDVYLRSPQDLSVYHLTLNRVYHLSCLHVSYAVAENAYCIVGTTFGFKLSFQPLKSIWV